MTANPGNYTPESLRDSRGWYNLQNTPGGICRFCSHPILCPKGKRVKAAAIKEHPAERREAPYEELLEVKHRLLESPPDGQELHYLAHWHPWCEEVYRGQTDKNFALRKILEADPMCGGTCGLDLVELSARVQRLRTAYRDAESLMDELQGGNSLSRRWRSPRDWSPGLWIVHALEGLGFRQVRQALVELDHIVPLWEGGKNEPENFQALCQPCHRAKTADEAKRRARAKRMAKIRDLDN